MREELAEAAEVWDVPVFDEVVDKGAVGAKNFSPLHPAVLQVVLRDDPVI